MRRWTAEQEAWLRERYPYERTRVLCRHFARRFGRQVSEEAMAQKASGLGLRKVPRDLPARAARTVRWSSEPEMDAWMGEHDEGQSLMSLSAAFAERFGFPLARQQICAWRSSRGRQTKRSYGGALAPIGTERDTGKGYVLVKVAERPEVPGAKDNWRAKHVLAWEAAHGPVPEGYDVLRADGDPANLSPDNLVAVPHRMIARLNSRDAPEWHDRESLEAALAWCELNAAIATAEASVPRTCQVCGKTFVPPDGSRLARARRCAVTCPECVARGRKARGNRSVKATRICKVCGKRFGATQSNQRRCPECIAAAPKWSWRLQKSLRKES